MGAFGKNTAPGSSHGKWLLYAVPGFFVAGATQCLANLPSYFTAESASTASLLARTMLLQGGTLLAFAGEGAVNRSVFRGRGAWGYSAVFAAGTLASILLLFCGLDRLAGHGAGAIGYPLAMGACIVFFQVYSLLVLREHLSPATLGSILLSLIGIAALAG